MRLLERPCCTTRWERRCFLQSSGWRTLYTHTYTHTHTHTHTHIRTHIRIHTPTHTPTYTYSARVRMYRLTHSLTYSQRDYFSPSSAIRSIFFISLSFPNSRAVCITIILHSAHLHCENSSKTSTYARMKSLHFEAPYI